MDDDKIISIIKSNMTCSNGIVGFDCPCGDYEFIVSKNPKGKTKDQLIAEAARLELRQMREENIDIDTYVMKNTRYENKGS